MKKKIVIIILMLITLLTMTMQTVSAIDPNVISGGEQETNLNKKVNDFGKKILGMVQTVAIGVALTMLIANAIKYMMASTGDKAEIKKHATVYIVGALLLFAGSGVLEVIKKFMEDLSI